MATFTPNYNLRKPADTDFAENDTDLNANWDTVDTELKSVSDRVTTVEAAWAAYTPTWSATTTNPTLGDGTLTGRYKQIGKTVHYYLKLDIGSTTNVGSGVWEFSLPVAPAGSGYAVGGAVYVDGSAYQSGATLLSSSGNARAIHSSGTVTGTTPFAWASGDRLTLQGTYEAA